jgi:adenylate cyclase
MTEADIAALCGWTAEAGLAAASETTLLQGFCERAAEGGLPLARGVAFIDTLHPLYEGRVFRWEREKPDATFTDYGRSTEGEAAERWRTSPWFRMLNDGESCCADASALRRRPNSQPFGICSMNR